MESLSRIATTLWQIAGNLGDLAGELWQLGSNRALLVLWIVWWLAAVNWKKLWPVLGKGAPRLKGGESAYYSAVVSAVFLENQLHDVILKVVCEINVDVWQLVERHSVLIQKTTEVQIKPNWAHAADAQTITNE